MPQLFIFSSYMPCYFCCSTLHFLDPTCHSTFFFALLNACSEIIIETKFYFDVQTVFFWQTVDFGYIVLVFRNFCISACVTLDLL